MEITLEIYNCFLSQKQLFTSWADEVQLECVMSTGLWDSLMLKIEQHWSQWCCVFCCFRFSWLACAMWQNPNGVVLLLAPTLNFNPPGLAFSVPQRLTGFL